MKRPLLLAAMGLLCLAALGCGDAVTRMLSDPTSRAKLMEVIAHDPALTREMADRLLAEDSTRARVFERVLVNGEARQALLVSVARDPMLLDGVIQFAVQESVMRAHMMTLFKGMQMAGAK